MVVKAAASFLCFACSRSFQVDCGRSTRSAASPVFMKWPNSPRVRVRVRVRDRVRARVRAKGKGLGER